MELYGCAVGLSTTLLHLIIASVFRCPEHRLCTLLIRKRIYGDLVGDHEGRIKAQTEMPYDLVLICLILVFPDEVGSSGKCHLIDIGIHLVIIHSYSVILKGYSPFIRIHRDVYPVGLISLRRILSYERKLFKLCHRIAAVGDHLPEKDIMILIKPFFDYREHVFTVDV